MTQQPDPNALRTFAAEYAPMSERELLNLAASYDSLVDPAQQALRAEFARRNLEPPIVDDPVEVTSQRLVTVRRYRDVSEAIVARSVLESAGIFCFLRDENLVRLDWQVSNFIGGLSLQVRPEDSEEAIQLLTQPVPGSIAFEGESEFVQPHCPRCGSLDITFEGRDRSFAIATTFMFGLPLPLGAESWRCHACACRWSDHGDDAPGDSSAVAEV